MTARLHCGDALTVLRSLPDGVARCCVTSPPYFGLRDYGTATWEGGDTDCAHVEMATGMSAKNTLGPTRHLPETNAANVGRVRQYREACGKCGAVRVDEQVGLERTPDEYVANMVAVFREVRRVLTEDGTLWLNLGDSYCSIGHKKSNSGHGTTGLAGGNAQEHHPLRRENAVDGLKHKDLIGIPWRVAFALQADGWWLRSDIIWSKPNPMPESVTDRPTKAHEYLFLLSKSARYYYDAAAIAEPFADKRMGNPGTYTSRYATAVGHGMRVGKGWNEDGAKLSRNARSVWTIPTQSYPEAHFATFPQELPRRCILAGSAPGDTVLDPFGGSGTTAAVATGNGRNAIHIDLNPDYIELARQRIGPMLCEAAA